jgi:glycosyltransferase involved in cell wall biosynthesis
MEDRKIVIVGYFGKEKMGVGVCIENIYPLLLSKLQKANYKITLVTNTIVMESIGQLLPNGIAVIKPWSLRRSITSKLFFLFIFPKKKYVKEANSVYFSNDSMIGFGLKNVISIVHDLNEYEVYNKHGIIRTWFRKRMIFRVIKRAKKIIVISDYVKNQIYKYFPTYRNDARIYVAHNGIKLSNIIKIDNNKKIEKPYFIIVGRIDPKSKMLYESVKIFSIYKKIFHETQLMIVGGMDPFCKNDAKIFIEHISIMEGINYLGYVSDEELDTLYRNAKATIFLSRYEGFGFPGLEAFCRGCPVITNGENEVNNELLMGMDIKIFENELDNEKLIYEKLARIDTMDRKLLIKIAAQFSWEKTVEKHFDIINNSIT